MDNYNGYMLNLNSMYRISFFTEMILSLDGLSAYITITFCCTKYILYFNKYLINYQFLTKK